MGYCVRDWRIWNLDLYLHAPSRKLQFYVDMLSLQGDSVSENIITIKYRWHGTKIAVKNLYRAGQATDEV